MMETVREEKNKHIVFFSISTSNLICDQTSKSNLSIKKEPVWYMEADLLSDN